MPFVDVFPMAVRAVRQAIAATWPEVTTVQTGNDRPGGIWEETEAKRVAFESLALPRAHIQWPPAAVWEHCPMTAVLYVQPCMVYYLDRTDTGASAPLRTKMKQLQDRLLDPALGLVDGVTATAFTVLPARFETHVYDGTMVEEVLLMRNQPDQAGALQFSFLVGDDARD